MTKPRNFIGLALSLVFVAQTALAGRIDRSKVWFGVEYTFQDQEMVDEPGRNTTSTPHKEAKARAIAKGLAAELGLPAKAVTRKTSWKPGWYVNVPGDGKWVVNSEPVTIEVNTAPKTVDQIPIVSSPIFKVTRANGLVAYVNPAAERSGMGHVHVGARVMGENPFFKNPLLLRNVMVYAHKNPAFLHGFAEAFDIGRDSNIETYHEEGRQELFKMAIDAFDSWYRQANEVTRREQGFNKFLEILKMHDYGGGAYAGFFEHYRLINLRNVGDGIFTSETTGKKTVEFRNFRPPKSPEVAQAYAELLLALMESQSAPGHFEKFEWITNEEYLRFNTGSKLESNWEDVRKDLGLKNDLLDAEINETADAVQRHKYPSPIANGELFLAYSRKGEKGEYFELRLPADERSITPDLMIARKRVTLELVSIKGKSYWIGIIDVKALKLDIDDLKNGRIAATLRKPIPRCELTFGAAG